MISLALSLIVPLAFASELFDGLPSEIIDKETNSKLSMSPAENSSSFKEGIEAVLNGDPSTAILKFNSALENLSSQPKLSAEEIEELSIDKRVSKIKPILEFDISKATILNNIAVSYILLSQNELALTKLDEASLLAPESSAIWINGGLAALALGKFQIAANNVSQAQQLGDKSLRRLVIQAEIALATQQFDGVKDLISQGEAIDQNDPYLLLVKARLQQELGQAREAERSLAKALIQGPVVAANSLLSPANGSGFGLGGGIRTLHLNLAHQSMSQNLNAFNFRVLSDRMDVEGRSEAYQWRDLIEGTYAGGFGTIYLSYRNAGGGRPGAETAIAGLTPKLDARFRLASTSALWVNDFNINTGIISTLAKFRSSTMQTRDSTANWADQIKDDAFLLETRYLGTLNQNKKLILGMAWSQINRSATNARTFDPAETILPDGLTTAWLAYGALEQQFAPLIKGTVGFTVANLSGSTTIQPIAEINFGKTKPIRFGISSRVNDTAADLIPASFLANSPLSNDIDRHNQQPQDFNTSPLLMARDSRFLNYEVTFPGKTNSKETQNFVVFHRRMENVLIQATDPRATTNLVTTPVEKAEATGLEFQWTRILNPTWSVRSKAIYQVTAGSPATPQFDISSFPSQIPSSQSALANFPRLQSHTELQWQNRNTSVTLALSYMGKRPRAVTVTDQFQNTVTYIGEADEALGVHLFSRFQINDDLKFVFGLYNLTQARFYTGYPAKTTGFFGFEYRY